MKVLAYHVDNRILKAWEWVQDCNNLWQQLTFPGAAVHYANGKAECMIQELQEMVQTMLIHANKHWSNAITMNLWP